MKRLLRIGIGLVVVVVIAVVATLFFLDSIARTAVERGGTYAFGVPTHLESASLGLTSGNFALAGFAIENPPGFGEPNFFALRSTSLELPLTALLEPHITIPDLTIEGVTLDLERNAQGTNYGTILDNLKRLEGESGGGAKGGGGGGEPAAGGGKTFKLERLVLRDARATVNLVPASGELTKLSVAIPEVVVEGFDSEMTLPQLCGLVVRTVVEAALKAGAGSLPDELLADLRGRVSGLETQARAQLDAQLGKVESKLSEQAEKLGPDAQKAVDDATKKANEKLGGALDGLLKGKKKN